MLPCQAKSTFPEGRVFFVSALGAITNSPVPRCRDSNGAFGASGVATPSPSSSRKSSRSKKTANASQGALSPSLNPPCRVAPRDPGHTSPSNYTDSYIDSLPAAGLSNSSRRSRRSGANPTDQDTAMTGTDETPSTAGPPPPPPPPPAPFGEDGPGADDSDEMDEDDAHRYDDGDDDGPFGAFGGPPSGLSSTLRALTGMISGISPRLRDIYNSLRQKDEFIQQAALQELSEILLVSNEDNLSGHFSPDSFVKELVSLMQPPNSPEVMLLACRCLANLMEALPASVANVVYGGAVPVLCSKLLEISFIDVAEQSLSTLEKISTEYPSAIVREGGLTACLSYLDFFATSTQRTAVTTAANCCRNIPEDSFSVVRDVMPKLQDVLGSNDQRVVEQASICVSGIVESFKYHPSKLEQLVDVDLLRAILRLLVPGTTNLIGPNIHTQFLRVLAFTARASPRLSADLFRLNVVETLYQILTGVSPPDDTEDVASKLDSVVIMQALIHRPREQIIETLNVICELLPNFPRTLDPTNGHLVDACLFPNSMPPVSSTGSSKSRKSSNDKRVEMLDECKDEVRRFALILFPTLTDAFSSTVNLNVRQKVLTAQLKMLSNLNEDILVEALRSVPYASFLAAILSQQDHPSLVMLGLQATELLISRLDDIYRYQLYREGVMAEIAKLSAEEDTPASSPEAGGDEENKAESPVPAGSGDKSENEASQNGEEEEEERETSDEENEDEDEDEDGDADIAFTRHDDDGSPVSSRGSTMSIDHASHILSELKSPRSTIRKMAKKFLETHETEKQGKIMKKKATKILDDLSALATDLENFYLQPTSGGHGSEAGVELFKKLASYFEADVLESVTSAELLASGLVRVLVEVFGNPDEALARAAQASFLRVFMGNHTPATPFSVMINKLQDLLSRSEHFEVITVHNSSMDSNRSSAVSMLGKQIRLRLMADDDTEIPRPYRNIVVSIQAIATFQSLDDYLRPRISLSERARSARRDGISKALAAMAGARSLPPFAGSSSGGSLVDRSASGSGASSGAPPPATPSSSARPSRKSKSSRSTAQSDAPATPSTSSREKRALRRDSCRQDNTSAETPDPPLPPPDDDDDLHDALECADEKPLTDDDEDTGVAGAFDALAGELDDDMGEEPEGDPSAVNLEVAGGKVTARNEDGSRVHTPGGIAAGRPPPGRTSPPSASAQATPTPSSSRHPLSYAAAMQSTPQDWHVEFSVDGKAIGNDTTIYRAIHQLMTSDDHTSRSIWSQVHSIKFKRVPGPPPQETSSSFSSPADPNAEPSVDGIPASLAKHPTTASILRLLRILHDLNANLEDVLIENGENLALSSEPLSQFVNTKLTAKLNRQLEEPLIVASNCLPSWSEDLARFYPFLFPFETRHLFLQSTSFGYARSMTRWQNAQSEDTRRDRRDERPFLGRLQRQKVRIGRSKMFESALKVMELYGASQSVLEVEYFEEVGTGLGPTLEFYSTISKEFAKKKLKLWREVDSNDSTEYINGNAGLFPRPISDEEASSPNGERVLHLFTTLGKFVARSMLDSRIIDINFNSTFFRIGDESSPAGIKPSLGAVKAVDPGLARSLLTIKKFATAKKEIDEDPNRTPADKVAATENIVIDDTKLDDLCLDFTLPGYPEIELVPGGSQVRVTISNVEDYLDRVIDMTLGSGVRRQVDAFRTGFTRVFPYSALSAFTPDELVSLFGRVDEDWSLESKCPVKTPLD